MLFSPRICQFSILPGSGTTIAQGIRGDDRFVLPFSHPQGKYLSRQRYNKPFMCLVILAGAAACLYSLLNLPYSRVDLQFLFIAVLTLCFGSRIGIEVSSLKVQITVSDTFIFLSLLLYGVEVAILLATAEAFISSTRFSKLWITRLFNATLLGCSTCITGVVAEGVFGSLPALTHSPLSPQ